ncbi:hypothetical protein TRFO_29398 [Tritrichomonas foetus]|uniref:Uncharacterized protein n=1 Tax=Tritrichomonas foetus TaxID=1144522 RepID=A0A1J4K199_9EUKA|nr:hypothetical protein TRFO_29398 [Tritrichomonas foetus]|eukprot:OHT03261.1 hypothetical protein TRFO_29398 [Tritrichomonas foetus]
MFNYTSQSGLVIQEASKSLAQKLSTNLKDDSVNFRNSLTLISKAPKEFALIVKGKKYFVNKSIIFELCHSLPQYAQKNNLNIEDMNEFELDINDPQNRMQAFTDICNGLITTVNVKKDRDFFFELSQILSFSLPNQWPLPCGIRNSKPSKIVQLSLSPGHAANFILYINSDKFEIRTKSRSYFFPYFSAFLSDVLSEEIQNDPKCRTYEYDFDDLNSEFSLVSDYFSGHNIQMAPQNMDYIQQIATDLKITGLIQKVENFNKEFEFSLTVLDDEINQTSNILLLQDLLFDLTDSNLMFTFHELEDSIWLSSFELVKELISNICVVACYRKSLLNVLCELCKLLSNSIPGFLEFLTNFILRTANESFLLCNFVYILYKNGLIPISSILNTIIRHPKTDSNNSKIYLSCLIHYFIPEFYGSYSHLLNNIPTNTRNYFYPIREVLTNNDYHDYRIEREQMQNQDPIAIAIANDDVDTLILKLTQSGFDKNNQYIHQSPFDNLEKLSQINYAAFRGSINCFKYLLLNGQNVSQSTIVNAVIGGNSEIIRVCFQKFDLESETAINNNNNNQNQHNNQNNLYPNNMFINNFKSGKRSNWTGNFPGRAFVGRNDMVDSEFNAPWHRFNHHYRSRMIHQKMKDIKVKNTFKRGLGIPILTTIQKMNLHDFVLYAAVSYHRYGVFEWYIHQTTNQVLLLESLKTCLQATTETNNIRALMLIMENGISLSTHPHIASILVSTAARYGFGDIFRMVISAAGKESLLDQLSTKAISLISASQFGSILISKAIFEMISPLITTEDIKEALHQSIKCGHSDLFFWLIEKSNFDIKSDLKTLFRSSASNGLIDILDYLLTNYMKDTNLNEICGFCAAAASKGMFDCVKLIVTKVMNDTGSSLKGRMARALAEAGKAGHIEICKYLLDCGAILDKDSIRSVISTIVSNGFTDILRLFFSLMSDQMKNSLASKFLLTAIQNQQNEVALLFVELSEVNGTALIKAAKNKMIDVVKAMVKRNNDPDFLNENNEGTALCAACSANCIEIVKFLLEQEGINPHIANYEGETPLIIAAKHKKLEIVKLLAPFCTSKRYIWEVSAAFIAYFSKMTNNHGHLRMNQPYVFKHKLGLQHNGIVNNDDFDLNAVKFFLSFDGIDINFVYENRTILEEAIDACCYPLLELLLERPELDLHICASMGTPILGLAAQYLYIKTLMILLERANCSFTLQENEVFEVFVNAVSGGIEQTVNFFLSEESPIKINSATIVRAIDATMNSPNDVSIKISKSLYNLDFDINKKATYHRKTLLAEAINVRAYEHIPLILNHPRFSAPEFELRRSLFICLSGNDFNLTNEFLKLLGNDVNQINMNGESLLVESVAVSSSENVNHILQHPSFDPIKSFAHRAFIFSLQKSLNVASLFITLGAVDINEPYTEDISFIHGYLANLYNNFNNDNTFEQHIPLPNSIVGWTPLMVIGINTELQDLVLQAPNIDINKKGLNGSAPIFVAIKYRSCLLDSLLNQPQIDLNIQNSKGWTPLIAAIQYNDCKTALKLLNSKRNIDFTIKDNQGLTAADYLMMHGNFNIDEPPQTKEEMIETISKIFRKDQFDFSFSLNF